MERLTTKQILAASFRELAQHKNIDKITVKDIVSNCSYSPATFYRYFDDKYDLIAWEHAKSVAEIMDKTGVNSWNQSLLEGALLFNEQKDYLKNLLLHTNAHDSFIRYQVEINYNALKNYILKINSISETDKLTDALIRVYCYGTVSLSAEWILGKVCFTPEELALAFEKSLPAELEKYLYK